MKINYATRQLIRSSSRGYLSTSFDPSSFGAKKINVKQTFPYSTFTLTAFDYDLSPIVLLSKLSEHTTNISKDNLVSLMLCEEQKLYPYFPKFNKNPFNYEDPMSRPRVTLIGKLKITKNLNHKTRFLNRHPTSNLYANFSDMNFYRLDIIGAHLIGGFASVKWFSKKDLICNDFKNFQESENSIISHMNDHHKESIELYVKMFIKGISSNLKKNWQLIGVDPDGFDLRKKDKVLRYCFESSIDNASKLRGVFVKLHKQASISQ